jgi:hypothetical protein
MSYIVTREIKNVDSGEIIDVGPDVIGMGLIEIRESHQGVVTRIALTPEQASLVADALYACVGDMVAGKLDG